MNILLVTPDRVDADLIRNVLDGANDAPFELRWVRTLSDGLEVLSNGEISAALISLALAEVDGIEAVNKLLRATTHIPTVVLGDMHEADFARHAMQRKTDDYLRRDHVDEHTLPRAIRNVVARKAIEDALIIERNRAQVTLNAIGDAVLSTDLLGNITYLNLVAEIMTGWTREEALGRPAYEVFRIIDGTTRAAARNSLVLAIRENRVVGLAAGCVLIRRDGVECAIEDSAAPIHDRTGQVSGAVIVFHDVSESLEMKAKMSRLALHDALTELPNRTLLSDRITQAIALAHRHGNQFATFFLDIDRFKHINDTCGHMAGDQVLRSMARRLVSCVRDTDTVSRLGGDEFVVLISEIDDTADALAIAEKIRAAVAGSHSNTSHDTHVTVSIGISVYPYDGMNEETLFKNADIALNHAKRNGRDQTQLFTRDMNRRAVERRALETDLRSALERGEFALHYQPKVNISTGKMTGAEALLRWHHPERGTLLPGLFVPIAEQCRLMVPIGQWVLREACRQTQAWRVDGLTLARIAVNISAIEFQTKGFLDNVKATLKQTGFDPNGLELELTESVLMESTESTTALLEELKGMGTQLAIDDFGTGYSSLSYLSRFPVNTLKIDQSFVRKIHSDSRCATIVSTVINMGKSLNHQVVAEGVETPEQLAFLRAQCCDEGQGYHFDKPLTADAFRERLHPAFAPAYSSNNG